MWSLKTAPYGSGSGFEDLAQTARNFLARQDLGFLRLTERAPLWAQSAERALQIRESHSRLVVVGMGGSSLGARAFLSACGGASGSDVLFFDNVDPVALERKFQALAEDPKVHWLLVSKSGSTIETLFTANHLLQKSTRADLVKNGITVITEPQQNPLSDWAARHSVPCLEIPKDVGGRFSVFTPAGLVPLAFAGVNLEKIRTGLNGSNPKLEALALQLSEQYLRSFQDEKWIHVLWPYADDLMDFGYWFQQLWAESLGKSVDRLGAKAPRVSTPMVLRGASDQHSVLQQIMEGERDKVVTFLRVQGVEDFGPVLKKDQFGVQQSLVGQGMGRLLAAEAEATERALTEAGVPCLRLAGERLEENSVAFLMQTFMICVGIVGESLNIDAFNQPGVEAGKTIAKSLLARS